MFVDYSDQCCGLQIADICAGIFTASLKYLAFGGSSKFRFSYNLLKNGLFEKIRHNDSNLPNYEVYKYGVKEVPKDIGRDDAKAVSSCIEASFANDLRRMLYQ